MSRVGILIVDDFEAWRLHVRNLLRERPEWQIVGEASDGSEAIQKATELQPDVILLDVQMPHLNGIEAAKTIRACSPKSKILFLTQLRTPCATALGHRLAARMTWFGDESC